MNDAQSPVPNELVISRKKFEFAILYKPGPNYVQNLPPVQQPIQSHRAYIETLRTQGTLIQGGPFPDNEKGIDPYHGTPIISVANEAEARQLLAQDPAIISGVLDAELRPWDIKFGVNNPFR